MSWQVVQRAYAKKYAKLESAGKALHRMEKEGVPLDVRPQAWLLKNCRPSRQDLKMKLSCVASLKEFFSTPPDRVVLREECQVVSTEQVRTMFSFDLAEEWLSTQNLSCFSMDFTWKTNVNGLLLGAIGPCGLKAWPDGKPHLRFRPIIVFLLSHSEDHESRALLLKKFVEMSKQAGVTLSHGFFDCTCYNGARSALESDESMCHVKLHRCLQHSKEICGLKGARKTQLPVSLVIEAV